MLSERKLKKWRREAFINIEAVTNTNEYFIGISVTEVNGRILELTQELLDQHLLKSRKEKKGDF